MLTMLAIAVLVPVGVGALVLALDVRISQPGRPTPSQETSTIDADPAAQPRATYQPLRDRAAEPARHANHGA